MIIRKPYAFLIKYFRRVHIVLLLLSFYVFAKNIATTSFLTEFSSSGIYSAVLDPISKRLGILTYLSLIVIIAVVALLMILLKRKGKPWKMYLVLLAIYTATLLVFLYITLYFYGYTSGSFELKTARMLHDLSFIVSFPQYIAFAIFIIRITGIDLKKFDFASDEEFLEIQEADKEEVEISFEFDKHIISRLIQKFIRNFRYFYLEHKFIMNIAIVGVSVILLGNIYYYFGVVHKSYRQGQVLNTGEYEIKVNKTYYTDKDYNGNVIEKNKAFIVLNLTVKNNSSREKMKMDRFHIANWTDDYTYTVSYNTDFKDLGKPYNNEKWTRGKTYNFLLIFKVNKQKNSFFNNFALYYQEYHGRSTYLRKMKIKQEDISKITSYKTKKMNQELTLEMPNNDKKSLTFTNMEVGNEFNYSILRCSRNDDCNIETEVVSEKGSKKIIKLTYESSDFEGKYFVDFSTKYGKISYIRSNGKKRTIDLESSLKNDYQGRYLFLKVPKNLNTEKDLIITYVIRNKKYSYKVR